MLLRLLALFVLGSLVPRSAQAWTRAHVREARARVELRRGAPAQVELDLLVDVQGGWLERLELPGLDDDLALSGPAEVTLDSGPVVTARTDVRAGAVVLRFERKDGVRRGAHRVLWVMPGWEAGLLAAEVTVVGPEGLSAVHDSRIAQEIRTESMHGGKQVRFARIHVPRQSPWHIEVALPKQALGMALTPGPLATDARAANDLQLGWWMSLLSLLFALAGRAYVRRRLRASRTRAVSWLGGRTLGVWWLVSCAALAGLAYPRAPLLALALLGVLQALAIEKSAGAAGPLPLGAFRAIGSAERRRSARLAWWDRLGVPGADMTSLAGLATAAGLVLLVALMRDRAEADHVAVAACLALGSLLASSRLRLPRSLSEQLSLLLQEAERLRVVSCAMSLLWYVTADRCEQPRIRLSPGARYPGLLRLEVLVDTRRAARPYVLNVLVTSDSPAERWTSSLWPWAWREQSAGFARTALLHSVDDVGRAVEELLEHFSRESERMLGQVSQPSRCAA